MRFEQDPEENYAHGLVFETEEEVEAVGSAYRELVYYKTATGKINELQKHELTFSTWSDKPERTIMTNHPLHVALLLERYKHQTIEAVQSIIENATEAPFDSDAIARRISTGAVAFRLSGLIKLEFDHDTLDQMLEDQGTELFAEPKRPAAGPFD